MRNLLIHQLAVLTALILSLPLTLVHIAHGQELCRGDIDGDGTVTDDDVTALMAVLFDGQPDALTAARADANDDGAVSGADLAAILQLRDMPCLRITASPTAIANTPTPTRTRPPSATATVTPTPSLRTATLAIGTPTATHTQRPTATPTEVCVTQPLQFGTTDGELSASDCRRTFDQTIRHTDVYTVVGTPGMAITVDVTPTSTVAPFVPFVTVIDGDGQFDRVDGPPPIRFLVTTTRPYEILVTSSPAADEQLGPYRLTLTSSSCPTPAVLTIPTNLAAALTGTECPAAGLPDTKAQLNLADTYTFSIAQVPTNVSIIIRQLLEDSDMDPAFSLFGPDGTQVVTPDQDDDSAPGGFGLDAQARFLALQTGVYTLVVTGGGCDPSSPTAHCQYSVSLTSPACTAKPLNNIPQDSPLTCPASAGVCSGTGQPPLSGCCGTLYGDTNRTTCAAPLPLPLTSGVPEPNSAADLYSFTGQPGDVISVEMDSDDDAHLFLLGPASAGNPVVAQDDDSGSRVKQSDAQLAATLAVAGTYTIVASNNNALQPPTPPDDPTGDVVGYTLFVQKCPVRGAVGAPGELSGQFSTLDCVGFGGNPFRSYAMSGTAGQFVSLAATSDDVDAFVRLLAPDGSQISNDNDLLDAFTSDARVNRILPVDGTYIIEVSSSPDQGAPDLTQSPLRFGLHVTTCPTVAVSPGAITGAFQDSDCELTPGRKVDVYTFAGPQSPSAPRVASVLPPSTGCVVALLSEGGQTPESGCSRAPVDFPVAGSGVYGFMIAANDETIRGAYSARFSNCPLPVVSFGDVQVGTLAATDCAAANGSPANWFLVRGGANLVCFNGGVSGQVATAFPAAVTITDTFDSESVSGVFDDDPTLMFPFKDTLASLLRISGATPSAVGNYTLQVDSADFQQ